MAEKGGFPFTDQKHDSWAEIPGKWTVYDQNQGSWARHIVNLSGGVDQLPHKVN